MGNANDALVFMVEKRGDAGIIMLRMSSDKALALEVSEHRKLVEGTAVVLWSYGDHSAAICGFVFTSDDTLATEQDPNLVLGAQGDDQIILVHKDDYVRRLMFYRSSKLQRQKTQKQAWMELLKETGL